MGVERTNQDQLRQVYEQTIDALIIAASQRDRTAEGHSQRVTRYSLAIGRYIGLSHTDLVNLKYAASLHDIGKIAISRKILNKLGKLTDAEFAIMKQHSTIAIRILERVEGLQDAAPIIKHHHERFDGKGYPDGLIGQQIPLGSRIIAVAEAYDILTSDVPWRDAVDRESALSEIQACAGSQFDPAVVAAFRLAITTGCVEN